RIVLAASLDPRVAILALDDLVGHQLGVLLGDRIIEAPADKALHCENLVVGIGDRLALRRLADQSLAVLRKGNDGRRRARALDVLNDLRLAAFHDCDAAVGRAQVDPNDLGHVSYLSLTAPHRPLFEAAEMLI